MVDVSHTGCAFCLLVAFLFLLGFGIQAAVDAHRSSNQNGGDVTAAVMSLLAAVLAAAGAAWYFVQSRKRV